METCSISDDVEEETDGEYCEDAEDDDFEAYYNPLEGYGDPDETINSTDTDDPEYFPVEYLSAEEVSAFFDGVVNTVATSLNINVSLAKLLLHVNNWNVEKVINDYNNNITEYLIASRVSPSSRNEPTLVNSISRGDNSENFDCLVCTSILPKSKALSLECHHLFCCDCWTMYVEVKINEGLSTEITCMAQNCDLLVREDVILALPLSNYQRIQYRQFSFHNYVQSHPLLRFCIGPNCGIIFKANKLMAKRVICPQCSSSFCFKCGDNYHAPTDCATIKNWLTKCADDSETANYFSAHTKDCPNCNICIEKNGGCNHMQCCKCKHDFCWMCLGDWKGHGSEYYECSRYKENPDMANESAKARAALRKYLHYYERWQNHAKSLKLEEKTLEKIKDRINQKVMNGSGTWIDWQCLLDAAALLAKCRYTLQYTYPYAYYMNQESKDLFEYQQGRLEAEIENLSWKVERAETTDRGDLENQMYIAEKRRKTLLKDFFQT